MILYNMTKATSPVNFSFLGCLDLVLQSGGGGKHPPSAAPGGKSPVLLGLNSLNYFSLGIESLWTQPIHVWLGLHRQ